jgi:hypothetical protein
MALSHFHGCGAGKLRFITVIKPGCFVNFYGCGYGFYGRCADTLRVLRQHDGFAKSYCGAVTDRLRLCYGTTGNITDKPRYCTIFCHTCTLGFNGETTVRQRFFYGLYSYITFAYGLLVRTYIYDLSDQLHA